MIKGIHHLALVVRDLDAAVRYHAAVGGMVRVPGSVTAALGPSRADLPVERCLLAAPNAYLRLIAPTWSSGPPEAAANPINRPGIRHFCVQNHDCSILERAVTGNGGTLIAPPLDLGTGNQYAYARDAEANIMEIEGLPYAPVAEPTWLGHVAIVTRDMDSAVAFYAGLFGTPLNNRGRFGPGPQYDRMGGLTAARIEGAWLPTGNMLLELWQFHAPECPPDRAPRQLLDPGYSHICLETNALEADAARLVALGGEVLSGVTESDLARSLLTRDREDNLIELLELRQTDGPLSIAALAQPGVCARVEVGRALA